MIVDRSAKVVEGDRARKMRKLDWLLARDKMLDMLFERIYKVNVSGKTDDVRFSKISKRYEQEQGENVGRMKVLRLELKKSEDHQAHGCRAHSVHWGLSYSQGGRCYQSSGDDPL